MIIDTLFQRSLPSAEFKCNSSDLIWQYKGLVRTYSDIDWMQTATMDSYT
jgi:hypothetical protein